MHIERISPNKVAPDGYKTLAAVEAYLKNSGLSQSLIDLVKMRASQINGCAYCLDMHSKDARKNGETEQRLYVLSAWHESSLYTPRERAALAWTESLTRLPETAAPDEDYQPLAGHFWEKEVVDLTVLIGMINLWNRVAIGMRYIPDGAPPRA